MKKLNTLVFALMVLLSITISATALDYKTINRQDGMSAYAEWADTNGDVSTYTDLFVMKTDDGADIGVSICTYDTVTGVSSCKSGYKFTQDNVFSIDKNLDLASLNAVEINLYEWSCDETGCWGTPADPITIEANWAGTGDKTKGSFKYTSKYGDYTMKSSSNSISREATTTGSINGTDLGTGDFGELAKFKSASMEMKK